MFRDFVAVSQELIPETISNQECVTNRGLVLGYGVTGFRISG
jgi:hypothetical protein